ncbi:hypothetical protein [Enterobacter hormaechei]|uniref:hypothetical protein n=1 Tax=Enterobacter hormaechei TaxID=158836 RepID=UPI001362C0F0|nr:hypothetical protein [Enterobacter hormaechei]QHI60009.1 hypothetical protein GTQ93_07610 [Enterobacter hormaechei]
MGFPSPEMDYQEQRLTIDLLCGIDGNCRVIETSGGWVVINVALRPEQGDTLLVRMDNRNEFVKLFGTALITEDGEAIECDALDEVEVYGVLTHNINRVGNDDSAPI